MSGSVMSQTVTDTGTTIAGPPDDAVKRIDPVYVPNAWSVAIRTSTQIGWFLPAATSNGAPSPAPVYGSLNGISASGTMPSLLGELAGARLVPPRTVLPVKSMNASRNSSTSAAAIVCPAPSLRSDGVALTP